MTITIEIPTNIEKQIQHNLAHGDTQAARQLLLDALVPTVEASIANNIEPPKLSLEEFKAQLDKLTDLAEQYLDPDFQPLPDHAFSRESFYERRPKL